MNKVYTNPEPDIECRAVYLCDLCGDAMETAPGACPRCGSSLVEDVAIQAWLRGLFGDQQEARQ